MVFAFANAAEGRLLADDRKRTYRPRISTYIQKEERSGAVFLLEHFTYYVHIVGFSVVLDWQGSRLHTKDLRPKGYVVRVQLVTCSWYQNIDI